MIFKIFISPRRDFISLLDCQFVFMYVLSVLNFTVQETVPSQESPGHSVKQDEDNEVEIPRTTVKRKRSSGKGRVNIFHYWFHV